ncbi:MAG: hypothetical protein JWP44_4506 [Mucilaginibacter sp.]|nr:hypothetical protein [Mucilaginibacter sp.]
MASEEARSIGLQLKAAETAVEAFRTSLEKSHAAVETYAEAIERLLAVLATYDTARAEANKIRCSYCNRAACSSHRGAGRYFCDVHIPPPGMRVESL